MKPGRGVFSIPLAGWAAACLLATVACGLTTVACSLTLCVPAFAEPVAGPAKGRVPGPIRILPLGDSVTQGGLVGRPEYTYRYPLYYMLKERGYDIDFVGSTNKGLQEGAVWPDRNGIPFDLDHEGHYGWKTAEVRDHLEQWMTTYPAPPDIVLLQLGSNDIDAPDFEAAAIAPLKDIIAMVRTKNPHAAFLVGHMMETGRVYRARRSLFEKLARDANRPDSPVTTVLHYKDWHERPDLPYSDTFDWAHPNPRGQQKMADKYLAAMVPLLDRLKNQ